MLTAWIFEENLRPFLTALAWAFTVKFDADDWLAISHGVKETDADHERWFEYEFSGKGGTVMFGVARDVGSCVLSVRVHHQENADKLRAIIMMCQEFSVRERSSR